jgi:ParB-like chromosome segregation protein Spo0J
VKRPSYAACFGEVTGKDFEELKADINRNGVLDPIIRRHDTILDGFARYEIARSLGIEYPVIEYDGSDELLDVIRWQRSSRDWTPAQEAKIAKALVAEVPARAEEIFADFHIAINDIGEVVAA